jgi:Ser/Thr protein kinase RdoA (MazF antagonist)
MTDLPAGLSMLWESVDPTTALADRFGFPTRDAAEQWVTDTLAARWSIEVTRSRRLVVSDQNVIAWVESDHGPLVVKWSRDAARSARLAATTALLHRLDDHGVPVAVPLPDGDGQDRGIVPAPGGPLSVTVLPELAGDWLDVEDEEAVHAAGAVLAQVHAALGSGAVPPVIAAESVVPVRARVEEWLTGPGAGPRWAAETARLGTALASVPDLDEVPQLVHGDFRAANVLTARSAVVGALDLAAADVRPRVLDLAVAGVLLGTRFRDWAPTTRPVRRTFRAGYESVRPLGTTESAWLDLLDLWVGLRMVPAGDDPAGWGAAVSA